MKYLLLVASLIICGCATAKISSKLPELSNSNEGLVFLIRPSINNYRQYNSKASLNIYVNDQMQSKLKYNSFTYFYAKTGVYKIISSMHYIFGGNDVFETEKTIDIQPGQVYYYIFNHKTRINDLAHDSINPRVIVTSTSIDPLDVVIAKEYINSMPCTVPKKERITDIK